MKKLRAMFTCVVALAMLLNATGLEALAATLVLPDSLEVIEAEAFSGDTSIDQVVLPEGVEEIRSKAFADSSVSSVNLPDSLTFIADDAFDGSDAVTVTADEGTYAYNWAKKNGYIGETPDLTDVVLEDTNAEKTLRQDALAIYNIKSDDIVIGVTNTLMRASEDAGKIRVTAYHTNVEPVLGNADPSKKKGEYIYNGDLSTSQLLQRMVNDQAILTIPSAELSKTTYIVIRVGGYTTSRAEEPSVWADFAIKVNKIVIPDNADDFEYGDWDAAYCTITGYIGTDTDVVIPDTAPDGRTVRGIYYNAFESNTSIQSVTIPSTVIQICDAAFKECTKLASVIFADGLEEINYHAFAECPLLTSISLPDSVTLIDGSAFEGCARLANVELSPNWKYNIQSYSPFTDCPKLTSIVIPEGMDVIPADAFRNMESLKTITLHEGIYKIENYAFCNCTKLTTIDLPDSLEEIGEHAFQYCAALTSMELPDNLETIGNHAFADCVKITSITVPGSVDVLSKYAFAGCTRLTSVTLPDTMRKVDNNAFERCTALTSIHLPDNIETMGMEVFTACERLATVNYPKNLLKAYYTFEGCERLTSITVPDGVTELPEGVFAGMKALKTVSLPETLLDIGENAFFGCSALTAISIPDGVDTIGSGAFSGCAALRSVSLPEKVDIIKSSTFSGCTLLSNVYIPEGVYKIEDSAFYDCDALTSVSLPSSLMELGDYVFGECEKLSSITIPDGIYELPNNTFRNDVKLSSVSLPANMDTIGSYAFAGCTALRSIQLPESLEKIYSDAFNGTALTSVTIPSRVEYIGSGVFANCERLSSVSLPDGLQELGYRAFIGCTALRSIALPDSIRKMGAGAFYNCTMLSTVNYPASLEEVTSSDYSPYAYGCERIRSMTVPDGVTVIPENAFKGIGCVRTITLPESVLEIKDSAFWYNDELTAVYIGEKVDTIADNAFEYCSEDLVIYGVAGSYAEKYAGEHGIAFNSEIAITADSVLLSGQVLSPVFTNGYADAYGIEGVTVTLTPKANVVARSATQSSNSNLVVNTDANGNWTFEGLDAGTEYVVEYEKAHFIFEENDAITAEVGLTSLGTVTATPSDDAIMPDPVVFDDYYDYGEIDLSKLTEDKLIISWGKANNAVSYIYAVKLLNGQPSGGDDESGISLSGAAKNKNVNTIDCEFSIDKSSLEAGKYLKVWVASVSNDGLRAQNVIYIYLSEGDIPGEVVFNSNYRNRETLYIDEIDSEDFYLEWYAADNVAYYLVTAKILENEPTVSSNDAALNVLYERTRIVDHFNNYPDRTVPIAKGELIAGTWIKIAVASVNAQGSERWSVISFYIDETRVKDDIDTEGYVFENIAVGMQFSDKYKETDYYRNLIELDKEITNPGTVDAFVKVALSQKGYHENSVIPGSEYGWWYINGQYNNQGWCAYFVSWCARVAGISTNRLPNFSKCSTGSEKEIPKAGYAVVYDRNYKDYIPQKGDLVFWDWNKDEAGHVGIVTTNGNKETGKVKVCDGNYSDKVNDRSIDIWADGVGANNNGRVYAYVHVDYSGSAYSPYEPHRLLKSGMKGPDVKWIQTKLKNLGYYDKEIDGDYGSGTKTAVEEFQRDQYALSVDGTVGQATLAALIKACS